MPARMRHRLKGDRPNGRMRNAEADDRTELVLVETLFDRRHQRHLETGVGAGVQSSLLRLA